MKIIYINNIYIYLQVLKEDNKYYKLASITNNILKLNILKI